MKILKIFPFLFLLLLLISINGYTQYSDTTKPATIYFIRGKSIMGKFGLVKIRINHDSKIKLKDNSFQTITYSKSTLNYSQSRISHSSRINTGYGQQNTPLTFLVIIYEWITYYTPHKYILDSIEPSKNYYLKFYPNHYPEVISEEEGIKALKTIELNKAAITFNKNKKTNNASVIKPKTGSHAQPPILRPDSSYIYFIRSKNILGSAVPIKIKVADSKVIYIPNNTSFVYSTTDSILVLTTINTHNNFQNCSLNLKSEKGKIYYIKVGMPPSLQLMNEKQALRFLSTY